MWASPSAMTSWRPSAALGDGDVRVLTLDTLGPGLPLLGSACLLFLAISLPLVTSAPSSLGPPFGGRRLGLASMTKDSYLGPTPASAT